MKIYLIMVLISFICLVISVLAQIAYMREHYKRIAKKPFGLSVIVAWLELFIVTLLVLPNIAHLLKVIFFKEQWEEDIDNSIDGKYFEFIE